jgi:hypothetical protein
VADAHADAGGLETRVARLEARVAQLEEILDKLAAELPDEVDLAAEESAPEPAAEGDSSPTDSLRTGEGSLAAYNRDGRKAVAVCAEGKRGPVHVYDELGTVIGGGE